MIAFEKERQDWETVRKGIEVAFTQWGKRQTIPIALINAHYLTKTYSERKFPSYQMHPYPTSFQAVDNVILWREAGKILLGKKKKEKGWRFPGGFVDPSDGDLERACARERQEECGIDMECSRPEYVASFRVQDPRYANSPDKIMSAIFKSYYLWGNPKAGDDIAKVRWFTKDYVRRNYRKMIEPCHHELVEILIGYGL